MCKKVKCALLQALRLCTGRTAHRGSRGIALPFHDHGTRRGWGVSVTLWPLFTPGKDPVPIVQEAGWAPGPVWTGVENLAPTGIRSPDRPARSQSLYRLRYPAHFPCIDTLKTTHTHTHTYIKTKQGCWTKITPLKNYGLQEHALFWKQVLTNYIKSSAFVLNVYLLLMFSFLNHSGVCYSVPIADVMSHSGKFAAGHGVISRVVFEKWL